MLLLSILAIIAVILIAGAIIAVIGNMIMGAFDNGKKDKKENDNSVNYQVQNVYNNTATAEDNKDYDFETINRAKAEREQAQKEEEDETFDLIPDEDEDEELSKIEQNLKNENNQKTETTVETLPQPAPKPVVQPIVEEDDDDFDDIDSLLDDISDEVVDKEPEKTSNQSSELDRYNINTYLNEVNDDEDAEVEEPEEEQEPAQVVEKIVVDNTKIDEQRKEIEDLKAQLEQANRELEEARNSKTEVSAIELTEQDCLERLAILEERLKNAKADLKVNMKEYRPLKKVYNNLEKYQAKLNRKEAIVANKKSSLYGVNNYVDIDKEQAEKLLNESELLEGLRLSVQHCEDVVAANKDRYPILEHTNKILTEEIEHIEQDIESTKQILQAIREKNGSNEGNAGDSEE